MKRIWKIAALAGMALATPVFADTVYLTNGASMEGRARYENGKVVVEQLAGDIIFDESRVEMIDKKRTLLDDYDDKLKALRDNPNSTGADYAALARFCEENGIKRHIEQTYRMAVAKDPDNAEGRLALGYVKYEGVWMTPQRANAAKGLVEHKGAWVTAEAKSDLLRLEAETEANKARAEVERLKLERTERMLEVVEAERDAEFDRRYYRNSPYTDDVVYISPGYGYRPILGSKPGNHGGKPTPAPQPAFKPIPVGASMFPPGSVGNSLFPRGE
jgi:hypothetical protein